MIRICTIACALLFLAGCSASHDAAISAAVGQTREFNDREARLSLMTPCIIRAGAYFRLRPMDRRAVEALCGGEPMPRPSDTKLAAPTTPKPKPIILPPQ